VLRRSIGEFSVDFNISQSSSGTVRILVEAIQGQHRETSIAEVQLTNAPKEKLDFKLFAQEVIADTYAYALRKPLYVVLVLAALGLVWYAGVIFIRARRKRPS
jgi:hypothetical protein